MVLPNLRVSCFHLFWTWSCFTRTGRPWSHAIYSVIHTVWAGPKWIKSVCLRACFLSNPPWGNIWWQRLTLQGRRFTSLYSAWHYIIVSLAVVSDCRALCTVFSSQKVCTGVTLVYCCELWSEKFKAGFQVLRFPALNWLVKFSAFWYMYESINYLVWSLSDFELIFLLKRLVVEVLVAIYYY